MGKFFSQKNAAAFKKAFTWKKVAIAAAIIALVAVVAVPRHIKKSRNEAAILLLQQIALVEMAMRTECMGPPSRYVFTDGLDGTAEIAIGKMAVFGFRPDPSVAFHIMRLPADDDVFIAFTAHNSVGSTVYVYDNTSGSGVVELRENEGYGGGIKVARPSFDLYCYTFDSANKSNPVKKMPTPIQFAPNPRDKAPARMVVTTRAID